MGSPWEPMGRKAGRLGVHLREMLQRNVEVELCKHRGGTIWGAGVKDQGHMRIS